MRLVPQRRHDTVVRVRAFAAIFVVALAGCDFGQSSPETRRVPNVLGMSWPDAAQRIADLGLCYDRVTIRGAPLGTGVGRVVAQQPPPGKRVPLLTQVRLNVSKRPDGRAHLYLVAQDPDCPPTTRPTTLYSEG
jgi:beta-lactam-binding protein with PASTA domain